MDRGQRVGAVVVVVVVLAITLAITIFNSVKQGAIESVVDSTKMGAPTPTLSVFDPNTVSYEELLAMGFDKSVAVSILKYRARGKVFEIAEEFALCYGVTDSMFRVLRPYITIGEQFRPKPKSYADDNKRDSLQQLSRQRWEQKIARRVPHPFERFRIDTVGIDYLQSIGFTYRQART